MAQAPPTLVSSKNDQNRPLAHPLRQIELQSNAQTPFLEAVRNTLGVGANGSLLFDFVVKDTFKSYAVRGPHAGIYTFPVDGFWIVTMWLAGGGSVALNKYYGPNYVLEGTIGQSTTPMTTWQFYAGPTASTQFTAFSVAAPGAVGDIAISGAYRCQLDTVCVAQY